MPIVEASILNSNGAIDPEGLLQSGPTIQVLVGASQPGQVSQSDQIKPKQASALVDTGASNCMIDSQLAAELGLIEVDRAPVAGVGGRRDHSIFMAAIFVPQLDIHQFGRFLAADLVAGGQSHQVLLGRDFLRNTIMIYDGLRSQVTIASLKK